MFFPDRGVIPASLPVPGKPEVNLHPSRATVTSGITPLVAESSADRTDTGAPPTEITLPFRIVRSGSEGRTVFQVQSQVR